MAVSVPRDEVRQALGFLERREILALQVLDEGELERILDLAHERGQPIEAGELRRPETPLPGHDLEAGRGRPHHDRLQEPVRLDRRRQLAELLFVEVLTWLIGVRVHVPEQHEGQHRALPTLHGARYREPPYRCPLALLLPASGMLHHMTHLHPAGPTTIPTRERKNRPRASGPPVTEREEGVTRTGRARPEAADAPAGAPRDPSGGTFPYRRITITNAYNARASI